LLVTKQHVPNKPHKWSIKANKELLITVGLR